MDYELEKDLKHEFKLKCSVDTSLDHQLDNLSDSKVANQSEINAENVSLRMGK
jgi:hypothetical protein